MSSASFLFNLFLSQLSILTPAYLLIIFVRGTMHRRRLKRRVASVSAALHAMKTARSGGALSTREIGMKITIFINEERTKEEFII